MKTVVIYHEAVPKLVSNVSLFIDLIVKIDFIVKIIVYGRNYHRRQNIIVYR